MNTEISIPWKRYALIAELAKRLEQKSPQLGKTALMKHIYLLQAVYRIDCGYDFSLYAYGPFDSQVLAELDLVAHFGAVEILPKDTPTGGYVIRPTAKWDMLRHMASAFLDDPTTKDGLDSLVAQFGAMTARDLELRATTVYVERDMRAKRTEATKKAIADLVSEIKPKFPKNEIEAEIDELAEAGHIHLAA